MNKRDFILLVFMLLIAFVVRIKGYSFGLPYLYHQDEKATVKVAVNFGSGDLNPHYFWHPNLLHYLLFFLYGATFFTCSLLGIFKSFAEFKNLFFVDPSLFYLIGRTLGALFGTGTVLVVYFLGKKIYGRREGLISAMFFTFNFLHVHDSHYIRHDVPVTFFIVLAYLFFYGICYSGKRSDYYLGGLITGLGISTNWNAAFLIVPLTISHLFYVRDCARKITFWNKLFCFSLLLVALGVVIGTPYMVLDTKTFLTHFIEQSTKAVMGSIFDEPALKYYFFRILPTAFGIPLLIVVVIGFIFLALFKHSKKDILLLSCPVIYLFIFTQFKSINASYIIPILPFLCIIAARFVSLTVDYLKLRQLIRQIILISTTAVLLFFPIKDSFYYDILLSRKDTRTQAKEWIESNIPSNSKIAIEGYIALSAWGPQLNETKEQAQALLKEIQTKGISKGQYRSAILELPYPEITYTLIEIVHFNHIGDRFENYYNFGDLLKKKVQYVVISEAYKRIFCDGKQPVPRIVAFYNELESKAKLVRVFSPFKENVPPFKRGIESWYTPLDHVSKLKYPGPVIYIYELPKF